MELFDEKNFVKQTILGKHGNCHSATIASALGIPIEEAWYVDNVPEGESWVRNLSEWLDRRGYVYLYVHANTGLIPSWWHLMSGRTKRGTQHSVIAYRGEVKFDPHPNGDGLTSINGYELILPKHAAFLNEYLSNAK